MLVDATDIPGGAPVAQEQEAVDARMETEGAGRGDERTQATGIRRRDGRVREAGHRAAAPSMGAIRP